MFAELCNKLRVLLPGVTIDPAAPLQSLGFPGEVRMFAGSTTPPGWLLCAGSAVSRTQYAALFAAIGTTWGSGDGSTTFALPDLRGRAPIGVGTGPGGLTARTLGGTGGEENHLLTTSEIPAHSHSYIETFFAGAGSNAGSGPAIGNPSAVTGSTGGGGSHANMQPWAALNFIIKW